MRVIVLFIIAICCVAAVQANSSDIKSIKKPNPDDDGRNNNSDKIKVSPSDKNDQKGNKDEKDIKTKTNETKESQSDCDQNETNIRKVKEGNERKENERKDNERKENERKENERKEKERKENERKEKERKENERKENDRKENECKENELKEKERKENERKENERKEKERKENERKENERKENERKENQRKENERKENERKENERKENERKENERKENERKENERKEKERKLKENNNERKENERKEKEKENECKEKERKEKEKENERKQNDKVNERKEKEREKERKEKENGRKEHERNTDRKQNEGRKVNQNQRECDNGDHDNSRWDNDKKIWWNRNKDRNPNKKYKHFHNGDCLTTRVPGPQDKKPLCGLPKGFCGKPRTFANKCYLEIYNAFNPNEQYEYFHDGQCLATPAPEPECQTGSPDEYSPICGLPDGFCSEPKTFANKCYLEIYNAFNPNEQYEYFHDGQCLTTPAPEPECQTGSPDEYSPICGLPDGFCSEPKTFANKCYLEIYNAFNPNEQYEYFHDGQCLTTPAPEPECQTGSPDENSPICGLPDGFCSEPKTFANKCYLEIYNAFNPNEQYEYFHDGQCLTTPAPGPECQTGSPDEDSPICGLPVGFCSEPKTFANKCYLEIYNAFNPNEQYEYFHDGQCLTTPAPEPECQTGSPDENSPICGLPDGFCSEPKTFANKCYLEIYNAFNPNKRYKYFHDSKCLQETTSSCDSIMCTKEYFPFCAIPDGFCGEIKTFSNDCTMDVFNCNNPGTKYKYFHEGECLTTPAPEPNCAAISCSNEGPAICGLPDGFCGEPRTFTNGCNLKVYNCFNPDSNYKYFHDGECLTTPAPEPNCAAISCSNEGPAICGLPDGFCGEPRTFTNGCNLVVYNCFNPNQKYKFFHNGQCLDVSIPETEPDCNIVCLDGYNPICTLPDDFCGKPKTFGNECSLNAYNCRNKSQKYKKFHDGQCLTDEPNPQCPTICPAIYKPVCSLPDGFCGEPKSYSSSCVLASYNCLNPNQKYTYFHDGECIPQAPVCPTICPYNYDPICATGQSGDLRTFSNECDFESFNCLNVNAKYTEAYKGECKECSDLKCNKIYQPVCATNAKKLLQTFGNPCQLQQYNCDNCNEKYEYSYDGECIAPIGCTKEYIPVCATSPTLGSKTFSNKCLQDSYISQHPDEGYTHAYDGECKPICKLVCTRNYKPICGIDSNETEKTFSNQCEFEKFNCLNPNNQYTVAYEGDCNNCRVACPKIYAPVCSLDSSKTEKQWSNQCELDSYNCRHKNDQHTVAYDGECHQCTVACSEIYEPVCSVDSAGNEKTWGNQCELDSYNCRYPFNLLTVSYAGECHKCKAACTKIYQPICAKDSSGNEKVWGNQCELDSYNCRYPYNPYTLQYQGECKPKCLKPCPKNLSPICGKDKNGNTKTFNNDCELDNYNCEHPDEKYTKSYNGKCKPVCQDICPAIYKPVCGSSNGDCNNSDAKTFSNQCALDSYNCQNPTKLFIKAAEGECPVNCKKLKCTREEKWICAVPNGFDGKPSSFSNDCERLLHNCNNPKNKYDYSHDGKCDNGC